MEKEVERIIKDIKSLKIQGARNVARRAVEALALQIQKSKAKKKPELYSELLEVADSLAATRSTEPMMRNAMLDAIRFTLMQIKSKPKMQVSTLRKAIVKEALTYLDKMKQDHETICDYGAKLIPDGGIVLTHCHSSTVTGILKRAYELDKNFKVVAFETRPRFQGRITAAELAKAGINTTLVVDGAMNMMMRSADLCIVGADALTAMGDLINKVGTSTLAHIARAHDVSFYSAAELYKYDPLTLFGNRERIEERDSKEVWEKAPKAVKVKNPAFDATAARYVSGYITELGIVPPTSLLTIARQKLMQINDE
ncbi:S-methyl-5-thioribose-1-phosphate isomerase [Candidatus Micrarchaeota archaeon]|nr:S-methyl-5-thioribose-1-phosphate isomerase [Candidatus Micrarchaeota archaeon]